MKTISSYLIIYTMGPVSDNIVLALLMLMYHVPLTFSFSLESVSINDCKVFLLNKVSLHFTLSLMSNDLSSLINHTSS